MGETEEPAYVIDFRNTRNCAAIESAKPGQEITVLVRPEKEPEATSVRAKGARSAEGLSFTVSVTTNAGVQSHSWGWELLLNAIEVHRGK